MTKAEAVAIHHAASHAIRELEGFNMPWAEMGDDLSKRVLGNLKIAIARIELIRSMANAELDTRK